jgi:5-hydroxyisourate hydrolase
MKKLISTLTLAMFSAVLFAQSEYQLSSHILDVSKGMPAAGISIRLEKYNEDAKTWSYVEEKITDENSRIPDF